MRRSERFRDQLQEFSRQEGNVTTATIAAVLACLCAGGFSLVMLALAHDWAQIRMAPVVVGGLLGLSVSGFVLVVRLLKVCLTVGKI